MGFNFYIFNLIIFIALSNTTAYLFSSLMLSIGLPKVGILDVSLWNPFFQIIIYFIISDFIQWLIHNLFHRVKWLWKFHKIHHSVTEMGFLAHFRFHFMENVIYKTSLYIVIGYLFNFNLEHAFFLHSFTILVGHLNHSNISLDYGLLKYILNNPKMHIWHHAKDLPDRYSNGVNFGISLSIWDYIFKTNYIPRDGRDISIGFNGVEKFPNRFISQQLNPFKSKNK